MQYSVVRPENIFLSPNGVPFDRKQKIDRQCFRLDLTQFHQHIYHIFFALAHTDDSAAADFKSNLLQHMNIFNTLVKGVGGADMAVIGAAAV